MGIDKLPFLCCYIYGTSVPVGSAFSQENGGRPDAAHQGNEFGQSTKGRRSKHRGLLPLASNTRKCKSGSFSFLDACMEGGDGMDAVTWHDLIYLLMEIATLIIVILSYLNSKKR